MAILTGVGVGSERIHTCTTHVAAGLTVLEVAPSRDEMARRIAEVAAGRWRRPGQGRHRATRALWRGQGREATGFRFYLLDGDRIVHGLRWHQGQNEEQLGEALKAIKKAGVIPAEQVRLCVRCDGAEWIGKPVQALFPQARQGLDYYHGAQDLHRVAKAHYGASMQAVEWVEATMTRLSLGKVGLVLRGLKRMQVRSDEAAKALANCWAYLDAHRGRTAYQKLRRGGYPRGSGGIESSNKFM